MSVIRWRHCEDVEKEHRHNRRQYAHTYHYPGTICLATAFWELPKEYRDGIILHEVGHLLAGPQGSEDDANRAIEAWSGAKIQYVDSPYGRHLERLSNMAGARIARRRKTNPIHSADSLPLDEWVPAHMVMFRSDGKVDVYNETEHYIRNVAGYTDQYGFHPIRWDRDYDPEEWDTSAARSDGTEPRGFFVGQRYATPKSSRPRVRRRKRK